MKIAITMKQVIAVSILFLGFVSAFAGDNSEIKLPYNSSKVIKESFAVTPNTSIEIINKYGDINVVTWEKDSVRFEINISADANKMSQVHTLMDMADVKFTANNNMVLAVLQWGNNVNTFKKSSVEVTLAAGSSQQLHIDYTIYMPKSNVLKIENRFGNVYLPDLKGKVYASIHHGNFKADKLANAKNISIRYGELTIHEADFAEISSSFTDVEIEKIGELQLDGSGGTVEIESVDKLELESTNQKVRIEKAKKVDAELTLSDLRIRSLSSKLNVNSKFGDVNVHQVEVGFSSIDIDANNASISIGFDGATAFGFEIDSEKPKTVQLPSEFTIDSDDKLDNYRLVKGKKGTSTDKKVDIATKACSISFEVTGK